MCGKKRTYGDRETGQARIKFGLRASVKYLLETLYKNNKNEKKKMKK
jgi:hypothetical protein